MKRISVIILLLVCGCAAVAQGTVEGEKAANGGKSVEAKSRPMDTLRWLSPTYYNQQWVDTTANCTLRIQGMGGGCCLAARYHYTDTPLRIIGAVVGAMPAFDEWYVRDTISLDICEERLQLYKHLPNGSMSLLDEKEFRLTDTSRVMRVESLSGFYPWDAFRNDPEVRYIPLYEVYFDQPHVVTDSFYIGCTGRAQDDEGYYPGYPVRLVAWWHGCGVHQAERLAGLVHVDGELRWAFDPPYHANTTNLLWLMPIIDTTGIIPMCDTFYCHEVADFRLLYPGNVRYGFAEFVWTGDPQHSRWQVAYGEAGTPPDSCQVIDCAAPTATAYGMRDSVRYVAYVRGYCTTCDKWGAWSGGMEYWKEMGDTVVGIRPTALEQCTQVVPNPARGEVSVISSFTVSGVEVYSVDGRLMLSKEADALQCVFDVAGWPAGTYIVSIRTPYGTTARRLAVE